MLSFEIKDAEQGLGDGIYGPAADDCVWNLAR